MKSIRPPFPPEDPIVAAAWAFLAPDNVFDIAGWQQDPSDVRNNPAEIQGNRLVTNDYQLNASTRGCQSLHHIIPYHIISNQIGTFRAVDEAALIAYVKAFDKKYPPLNGVRLGYSVKEIAARIFCNPANLVPGPYPGNRSDDPGRRIERAMLNALQPEVRKLLDLASTARGTDFLQKWTQLLQTCPIWQGVWQRNNSGLFGFSGFLPRQSLPSVNTQSLPTPDLSNQSAFPSLSMTIKKTR